jgi:hypothetical protein
VDIRSLNGDVDTPPYAFLECSCRPFVFDGKCVFSGVQRNVGDPDYCPFADAAFTELEPDKNPEEHVSVQNGGSASEDRTETMPGDVTRPHLITVYGSPVRAELTCEGSNPKDCIMYFATDSEAKAAQNDGTVRNNIRRYGGGSRGDGRTKLHCPSGCELIVCGKAKHTVVIKIGVDPNLPPNGGDDGICFSAEATVQVLDKGAIAMKDLMIGDKVLVGSGKHEPVYAFGHRDPTKTTNFLQVFTSKRGRPLEMCPRHLVYVKGRPHPVAASSLQVGDILQGSDDDVGSGITIRKIKNITRSDGVYAPFTPSGNIVVDGIKVSTYVSLQTNGVTEFAELANGYVLPFSHHFGVHMGTSPFRFLCMGISASFCSSSNDDGFPIWVDQGRRLAAHVEQQCTLVQLLWLILALAVCTPFYAMEVVVGARFAPFGFLAMGFIAVMAYQRPPNKREAKEKEL